MAALVQARVSAPAKEALVRAANADGLSEAAYLRKMIYDHFGLTTKE